MREQPYMHFEPKGWGWERWIVNKPEYCGKLLFIAKDRHLSLHYHKKKDETFYLQSGEIRLFYFDDLAKLQEAIDEARECYTDGHRGEIIWNSVLQVCDSIVLKPGDNFHIPVGRAHSMWARRDSELYEFSTFHEESDSYRLLKGD